MKETTALDQINKTLLAQLIVQNQDVEEIFVHLVKVLKDSIGQQALLHPDSTAAENMRIVYQDLVLIIKKLESKQLGSEAVLQLSTEDLRRDDSAIF